MYDRFCSTSVLQHVVVRHSEVTHLRLVATPRDCGLLVDQIAEALCVIRTLLEGQPVLQHPTVQTVFLKDAGDQAVCERLFTVHYGDAVPVTTFVHQPPCNGARLAIELCSIGGPSARIERPAPDTILVSHHGIDMIHCGRVTSDCSVGNVYDQSLDVFRRMKAQLAKAGIPFERVLRTWLYLGDITGVEGHLERYMELNRARSDFYREIRFGHGHRLDDIREGVYPASTGIGTKGGGIVMHCTAMDTQRNDVYLQPIENPQQTPVYHYETAYSPQSPKFSRAMAMVADGAATLWISGTASILQSKTVHIGDVRGQTEQTIKNIEELISADNLARHGIAGNGATLSDVAGLRVYIKHQEHYPICRAVCEARLGHVPILYAVADVCRSDLLMEMEGIAYVQHASVG